jgi:hypothetical protein
MKIKCPVCKYDLYLRIEKIYFMSVMVVGILDVIPGETLDSETKNYLECIDCGWKGWTDEYHQEQNGIANLNARRKDK